MTSRQVVDAIQSDSRLTGVEYVVGRKEWKRNRRPPYVAWIPTDFSTVAPQDTDRRLPTPTTSTVQVASRLQTFEIKCYGKDLDEAERLYNAVTAAIWKQSRGSQVWGSGTVTTQGEDAADYAVDGELLTFNVQLLLPVNEDATAADGGGASASRTMTVINSQSHIVLLGDGIWGVGSWGGPRVWGEPTQGC